MTNKNEISIRIGGQNGDGIFSSGETLAKVCSRSGLEVHGSRLYQSVIRGGHVSYSVRAANHEVRAPANYISLLIALREDGFKVDCRPMMKEGGIVLYDSQGSRIRDPDVPPGIKLIDIPAMAMAREIDPSLQVLKNTVFVGAALALYGFDLDILKDMLRDTFESKGENVVNINLQAADAGYEWIRENEDPIDHNVELSKQEDNLFIGGNESLAFGMLNGGLQSYSWYPMTPATPIGNFLSEYGPKNGCIVKQMEDEINVANYAVGAGYAGARAACGTSGGGFALMSEAVGFAGMIEAPVVFIEVARGGPSTGLPTKTSQGDLKQMLGASQGDYPRAIIAQEGVEDGFYLGQEALNIAERYQMPVIISSDLYMGEHFETLPEYDWDRIPIDRGKLITDEVPEDQKPYKRYKDTDDGVSPRTIPGVKGGRYDAGSDEHDEEGNLISDVKAGYPEAIEERRKQMNKRMRKVDELRKELPDPEVEGHSADESDILIVSWGSLRDIIREARSTLEDQGIKTSHLNIKYIVPFKREAVKEILNNFDDAGKKILMIENNYSGQMARHIAAETGFKFDDQYLRYDGEYILPRDIVEAIQERF